MVLIPDLVVVLCSDKAMSRQLRRTTTTTTTLALPNTLVSHRLSDYNNNPRFVTGATYRLRVRLCRSILGNKIANKLVKQATFEPIYKSETTSFAFLGIEINKVKTQEIYNYLLSQKLSQHLGSYCNIY